MGKIMLRAAACFLIAGLQYSLWCCGPARIVESALAGEVIDNQPTFKVVALKSGAVCRDAVGARVLGPSPKPPFAAVPAPYDRIKVKVNNRDCYFNPGEYVRENETKGPCPSSQIAKPDNRNVWGTRDPDELSWCEK